MGPLASGLHFLKALHAFKFDEIKTLAMIFYLLEEKNSEKAVYRLFDREKVEHFFIKKFKYEISRISSSELRNTDSIVLVIVKIYILLHY